MQNANHTNALSKKALSRALLATVISALSLALASHALAQTPSAVSPPASLRIATIPFRTDAIDIPLASGDDAGHWQEWKLRAKAGSALVYSWSVTGVENPDEFFADFHGHTEKPDAAREDSFRQISALSDSGGLTLPFDGVHGWYFKNDSAQPVVIHIKVAGFYTPLTAEELKAITDAETP